MTLPVGPSPEVDPTKSSLDRGPTTGDPTLARSLHTTTVVTPEAVLLEFRAAGVGSRMLAKAVDLVVQVVLLWALFMVLAVAFAFDGSETGATIAAVVGFFVIAFGYSTIEAFWAGTTVGKRVFGLKVITVEGGPVRFRHVAIRSLIWWVEFLIPPGGVVALGAALLTRRSQRIGDLAAGTVVIRSRQDRSGPVFFPPAFGGERFSQTFDASRLQPPQYALIREFLIRSSTLTPQARSVIARRLAEGVEKVTGIDQPPFLSADAYLLAAAFAYQHRWGATADLATAEIAATRPAGRR